MQQPTGVSECLKTIEALILDTPMRIPLPSFPPSGLPGFHQSSGVLERLEAFGTNPGNLAAYFYRPDGIPAKVPLVVVLHGCTQTAASYDQGSGWTELARRYGFATLFPEQKRQNNPNLCFNWFTPDDTRRGGGEAFSIAQMIEAMIAKHGIDGQRIFITGLSAGGAMTSAMLASYPELFAGGAILAGLPHGAATTIPEALQQMRAHSPSSRTTGRSIRMASPEIVRWPTVSVWHGTADTVVSPSNAEAILRQWQEVHEITTHPEENLIDGYPHRAWYDASGRLLLEDFRVTGMGHGTPLASVGECGCGQAGAFMLEVGISSTVHTAMTWALLSNRSDLSEGKSPVPSAQEPTLAQASGKAMGNGPAGITRIIEDALRAAGLLK